MKNGTLTTIVLAGCLFAVPLVGLAQTAGDAADSHLSVTTVDGDSLLQWHRDGRAIKLQSGNGRGVRVTSVNPAGLLGLQRRDVIFAVNGHNVPDVRAMVQRLRAIRPEAAELTVRRGGKVRSVTIAAADYACLLAPRPPVPPAPPTSTKLPGPPMPPTPPSKD